MMSEQFISIAPQKIRNSLATQGKMKYTPYKYNRVETFVTIATQTECCGCGCYKRGSTDARCCGVCFLCCPPTPPAEQCNCCPTDFAAYWDSGYVQTISGYGTQAELNEKNGVCCWLCFPLKFGLFFPCCLGSFGNGCLNYMRNTKVNYFF